MLEDCIQSMAHSLPIIISKGFLISFQKRRLIKQNSGELSTLHNSVKRSSHLFHLNINEYIRIEVPNKDTYFRLRSTFHVLDVLMICSQCIRHELHIKQLISIQVKCDIQYLQALIYLTFMHTKGIYLHEELTGKQQSCNYLYVVALLELKYVQ